MHATHYGRICPIETPEGPNIGLIASLSTYARVNEFGFIETPYRSGRDGKVTDEIAVLLGARGGEAHHRAGQRGGRQEGQVRGRPDLVPSRRRVRHGEARTRSTLMDVSPNQLVSVAASLIPFLENDDANRALMGSNMQRQAVPLIRTTRRWSARASRASWPATPASPSSPSATASWTRSTRPASSSDRRRSTEGLRSRQRRRHLQPDEVPALQPEHLHQPEADRRSGRPGQGRRRHRRRSGHGAGRAGARPERARRVHALGRLQLRGLDPHLREAGQGRLFTSIHIEEFECVARDTKLGKEEITRDIPNVGEEALKDLDESGIIRIGAEVKPGDILVGKITPKGETQLSPEEKLLRAIFGEKAGDVRDTSLRVPPGVEGIVINAKVFSRKGAEKDERAKDIEDPEKEKLLTDQRDEVKIVSDSDYRKMRKLLVGKTTAARWSTTRARCCSARATRSSTTRR